MRRAARIVGIVWMVACTALWLWVGLIWDYQPVDLGPWPSWTLPHLLQESKFGMTALPILLGLIGYSLYRWGRDGSSAE